MQVGSHFILRAICATQNPNRLPVGIMISREVESLVDIFIFSGWLGDIRCSKVFACTGQDIDMCQILLVAISDTCVSKADIAPVHGPVTSPVASEVSYDPSPVVGTKRAGRVLVYVYLSQNVSKQ